MSGLVATKNTFFIISGRLRNFATFPIIGFYFEKDLRFHLFQSPYVWDKETEAQKEAEIWLISQNMYLEIKIFGFHASDLSWSLTIHGFSPLYLVSSISHLLEIKESDGVWEAAIITIFWYSERQWGTFGLTLF